MSDIREKKNNIDKEIIARFLKGDKNAFEELVILHSEKCYQISFGLLGDKQDAEEVVQDTFLKVYKNLEKFRGDASFNTWLYRIVTNLSRNKYHWHRRRGAGANISISSNNNFNSDDQFDMEIPDNKLQPERFIEEKERRSTLTKALELIPSKLKEVIILRHFEDMTYADIATLLNCNAGTIKSRLSRARELLKRKFVQIT